MRFESLLGLAAVSGHAYLGSARRETKLRPMFALRVGRIRLSEGGAGGLLDFGAAGNNSGASLEVLRSSRWKVRTGLRLSSGRDASDDAEYAGMPGLRRTVFGRVAVTYSIPPHWRLVSALHYDLLGRDNGMYWSTGVDFRYWLRSQTELHISAGVTMGNATHLNSWYGIPRSAATASRPYFEPRAGLKDGGVSVSVITALSPNWIGFTTVSYARLLGDAAASPLAQRTSSVSATIGVGWRWRRANRS